MKVIVLMGGYGTRMRPHSWSRPKPVMQVGHNTVLGHILDQMAGLTTGEVILVVGYLGEQIEAWAREHYGHLDLHFVYQHEPLGQAHALWLCRDRLDAGEVIVSLGDIIIEADFAQIAPIAGSHADAVFQTMEIDDPRRYGCLTVNQEGMIDRIVEKPHSGDFRLALAGVYWFRDGRRLGQTLDQSIENGRRTNNEYFLADAFQLMLERGDRIGVQPIRSIVDVGSPANRLAANRVILERHPDRGPGTSLQLNHVTVVPPVYIHPAAAVECSTIGPFATIGAGARIRQSVIAGSIIDPGATVEGSVLRDSIIGANAVVTGQTQTLILGDDSIVGVHPLTGGAGR
ncbi:MAG TPA: NDP-sugar synthase [Promineifilum sp.]